MNRLVNWVVLWALGLVCMSVAVAENTLSTRDQVESSGILNATWVDDQLSSSGQIAPEHVPLLQSLGVRTVMNLAVYNEEYNGSENEWLVENGLTYVHLPVDFERPTSSDLKKCSGGWMHSQMNPSGCTVLRTIEQAHLPISTASISVAIRKRMRKRFWIKSGPMNCAMSTPNGRS